MINKSGDNLVFLLSMPRSGSTALSMILDAHEAVLCPPEPWIMLGIADLFSLGDLASVPYGQESALYACAQFIERLSAAESGPWLNELIAETARARFSGAGERDVVNSLATSLYAKYLELYNKRVFVDKTPRYFRILELLDDVFPKAKKVFLKRNPMDVAASYKSTWGIPVAELTGESLTANTYDFCRGLFSLEEYFSLSAPNKYVISYEELVASPEGEVTKLCDFLGISFRPEMLEYFQRPDLGAAYGQPVVGDPRSSQAPGPLDVKSIGRWKTKLTVDDKQRLITLLGSEIFEKLGYANVIDELSGMGLPIPDAAAAAAHRAALIQRFKQKYKDESASQHESNSVFRALHAIHHEREMQANANQKLAAELAALKSIQLHANHEALVAKLAAKNEVIKTLASQELQRKAFLWGVADLAWRKMRKHVTPGYGRNIPSGRHDVGLHVAIDALVIDFGISGGVETYMKMLISALIDNASRVTIICLPNQLEALRHQFQDRVGYFVVGQSRAIKFAVKAVNLLRRKNIRLSAEMSMVTFSRLEEDLGVNVLHSPVQVFSTLDFRLPAVLNLHDLQHLHFPENFRPAEIEARNYLYGLSAALADAIIVSSDFVRNDLINQMHIPPAKVFTVPVTWNPMVEQGLEQFSADMAREHYKLPPLYALYPAQFWPHKNHVRLVEALRIVRDRMPDRDLKLVLTGYRGHSGWSKVEEAIKRLRLESDVICLDYVPVEHLAGLYKAAVYCVMPSTFEASSYPVIEAQMLGVPAMCSNVTSLPELMRDGAGLLFDPFDAQDIADKMIHWLECPEDRQTHAERAIMKARKEHSLANYISGIGRVYEYALNTRR